MKFYFVVDRLGAFYSVKFAEDKMLIFIILREKY